MVFIIESNDAKVAIPAPEYAGEALRQLIQDELGADPGEVLADGQFHKFKTKIDHEKGRSGCGSYKLEPAGPVAIFGSHRPGEADYRVVDFDFPGKDGEAWKAQAETIRQTTEAHIAELRKQAAAMALSTFQAASPLAGDHFYLQSRGVALAAVQYGKLRIDGAGNLMVPMANPDGELCNVQTIHPDGKKRFVPDGETAGLLLAIPARPTSGQAYYLCEGLAKALAIWTATGSTAVCAFSAGNLARVAAVLGPTSAIVAADGDTAGREAAEACRTLGARAIYPAANAGDWNDVLVRQGVDVLRALLTAAPLEGPQPLYRPPDPSRPFPLSALGDLAIPASVIADHLNIDRSLVGSSILAATNLAACGTADVWFKSDFVRPMSLFMLTLGESGSGKSPADSILLRPHRDVEREWEDQYTLDAQLAADAVETFEEQRAALKKETKDLEPEDRLARLTELGPPPGMPTGPHLLVSDSTLEGIGRIFESNRPILGSFSDEAGRLLSGWALSKDNAPRTLAGLTDFWEGRAVKVIRASSEKGTTVLRGKRLALHWSVQPYVAEPLFADRLYAEQGFLPRMLTTRPSLLPPKPLSDHDIGNDPALAAYGDRIRHLLTMPLMTREGAPLELSPPAMKLAPNARAHFKAAWDYINAESADGKDLEPIRGFARKLPDNILRLAATLAKYHDPETLEIELRWIEAACDLATFYTSEMLRVHSGAVVSNDLREAEKLVDWIRAKGLRAIYPTMVYRLGPASLRSKAAASKVIRILVDHGHLSKVAGGLEIEGAFRPEAYLWVDSHV
jgi:phage/plasmid primase-like uncharacterized protein